MHRSILLIASCVLLSFPLQSHAQALAPSPVSQLITPGVAETVTRSERWDLSLYGQVGVPRGHLQVGENTQPGTRLRLHEDLGIDVSGAVEGNVAYHFTASDAVRAAITAYFIDGSRQTNHAVFYNGVTHGPGRLDLHNDFYRFSAAYERRLVTWSNGATVTGTAGLTYVFLNTSLNGDGEDFYLQELPVPILGARVDSPLRDRFGLSAFVAGGGIPPVNSLRKEGGTVTLDQAHADAGLRLTYALTRSLTLEAGYRFTYFFQHEHSHEDDNRFLLIDSALRLGVTSRF